MTSEQTRTRELLLKYFPEIPTNSPVVDFTQWLEFVCSFLKKESTIIHSNEGCNGNNTNMNDHHKTENISEDVKRHNASSVNGGDTYDKTNEILLLQNAQLQKSLDEYKNIVADTVSITS